MSISTRVTFSHIKDVLRNASKINKPPLGRWSLDNRKHNGLIVDYANEDHCGECSSYRKEKITNSRSKDKECETLYIQYESMMVNMPE